MKKMIVSIIFIFSSIIYATDQQKFNNIYKYSENLDHDPNFYQDISSAEKDKIKDSILLTADLQLHYLYGYVPTRFAISNKISPSIRPIASDLYAPLNFNNIIKSYQNKISNGKVIILGDAIDISCDWEASRFFNLMEDKINWVLAPGNHDSVYVGSNEKKSREESCFTEKGGGNFEKNKFILLYLNALAKQGENKGVDSSFLKFKECFSSINRNNNDNSCIQLSLGRKDSEGNNCFVFNNNLLNSYAANINCGKVKDDDGISNLRNLITNQGWWKNKDDNGFLQDVFWYINPEFPIYSFILQRVKLDNNKYALLIDTNNPQSQRGFEKYLIKYNAANSANMLHNQIYAATLIMNGEVGGEVDYPPSVIKKVSKQKHVLMSHHPLIDYTGHSRLGLSQRFSRNSLCILASVGNITEAYTAHTHKPQEKIFYEINSLCSLKKNRDFFKNKHIVEINIGSMIDFPLEYVLLSNIDDKKYRINLSNYFESICREKEADWRVKSGNYLYYDMHHKLRKTFRAKWTYKNTVIMALGYYLKELDPKYSFVTVQGDYPFGLNSDSQLINKIQEIQGEISRSNKISEINKYTHQLIEIDNFFFKRKVENQLELEKYRSCQLHWASYKNRGKDYK